MTEWSPAKALFTCAGVAGAMLVLPPAAQAAETQPVLVHASPQNECRLNVRAAADVGSALLGTLNCTSYTTCVGTADTPCGPYVTGGEYTCVGADGKQVTDHQWAEVTWRAPQKSYVAVACAVFRS